VANKVETPNGHERLTEAMALLIQNQASFLGRIAEIDRVASERFARLETDIAAILRVLAEHGRVLADHGRLLERLPEAVRDKIGFNWAHRNPKRKRGGSPASVYPRLRFGLK
jgi:hypothetical protein